MKANLVDKARASAKKYHGAAGQVRKYSGEPYTLHLQAVAELVGQVSGTPEMVSAAWLHDVVEDTSATIEDVTASFGCDVAVMVAELTDISTLSDGNRATRKALDRDHIANASKGAKTIKLADLIDNARSIIDDDPRFAVIFIQEMEALLDVLVDGDNQLYAQADKIIARYYRS